MKLSISIILLSMLFFTGCSGKADNNQDVNNNTNGVEMLSMTVGDNLPVSRSTAAKMIALAFNDINTIERMDREITFNDTSRDMWYDKYINTVYVQGYMSGSDNMFMPEAPLSLQQAQHILDTIDENNSIKLQITDENRDMPISYALWVDLYKQALENISGESTIEDYFNIKEKQHVVLATEANNTSLAGGIIITDKGMFVSEGLINDSFIDKEITILEKGDEVIAILSVNSIEPTIKSAYVVTNDRNSITIFSGGVERTYNYENSMGNISGKIVDIQISNEDVLNIYIYDDIMDNKVIRRVGYDYLELEGEGRINISDNFKVYTTVYDNVRWRLPRHLIVGTDIAKFVVNEGEIVAAIITEDKVPHDLRIVIGTTDFTGLIHNEVEITATENFKVVGYNETREYTSDEVVTFKTHEDLFGNDRVYIETDPEGLIQINNISRNWPNNESPKYRGIMEVAREEEGFTIINELGMDEYLYAVIPSEMPSSYGVEASKVQAITARSYAHNQLYDNRFHIYGANIDDSVMSQVYNNTPENDISIQAVDETKGLYLTYDDSVISARFFSTSSGMTANEGEVWADHMNRFPTESRQFLQSTKQYFGEDFGDLSLEENAARFLKETNIESYDSDSPWFRWSVEMTAEQVAASINANLESRYEHNPFLIRTLQDDGTYRNRPVNTIGELVNIEVLSRGEGGNIYEMKITGTENTIIVNTEYNIRYLLAPTNYIEGENDVVLRMSNGSTLTNYSLMPSSFFTMERLTDAEGNIVTVRFLGGGNGHGAGMSQYGAKGKLEMGYDYVEVLEHFYNGAEITQLY